MPGVLLDTHTLYWLVTAEKPLRAEALVAIRECQDAGTLLVSPISAWELAVANTKARVSDRPNLGDDRPERWFRDAIAATGAKIVPIRQRISMEAANFVARTGHKDPGDSFLIATARVRMVPIVTRDSVLRAITAGDPAYFSVIVC